MFKLFTTISVAIFVILPSFGNDGQLEKIEKELKRTKSYMQSGISNAEIEAKYNELLKQKKELLSKSAKKPASKTQHTSYQVDTSLSSTTQLQMILSDLSREQNNLQSFRAFERKGKNYQKSIVKTLRRIEEIELAKTRVEKKLSSSNRSVATASNAGIKVGAMIDLYYLYSPEVGVETSDLSNRNYDTKHNDFTMNLLELNFSGSVGKVDFYADLDFGYFAEQNSGEAGDPNNHNIGQAFLTYNLSDITTISAGKMYTHVGYEVAKAQENWNYSRSYAFTLAGPFWHEGVAVKTSYASGYSSGLFLYDTWDGTDETNSNKTVGVQFGYSNDKLSFLLNYASGDDGTTSGAGKDVIEFNTQYQVSTNVAVALNGVMGTDKEALAPTNVSDENIDKKWSAYVVYVNWQASDKWSFTPRYEIFNDDSASGASSGYIFGGAEASTVNSLTLTSARKLDENSELRFEVRSDSSSDDLWTDTDGEAVGTQNTLSASWLLTI